MSDELLCSRAATAVLGIEKPEDIELDAVAWSVGAKINIDRSMPLTRKAHWKRRRTCEPAAIKGFRKGLAVLVAIDNYVGGVPVLQTPFADAEKLAKVLRDEHGFDTQVAASREASAQRSPQASGRRKVIVFQ